MNPLVTSCQYLLVSFQCITESPHSHQRLAAKDSVQLIMLYDLTHEHDLAFSGQSASVIQNKIVAIPSTVQIKAYHDFPYAEFKASHIPS